MNLSIEIENNIGNVTVNVTASLVEVNTMYEAEYALVLEADTHGYFIHNKTYQLFEDNNEEIYAIDEELNHNYGIMNAVKTKLYKIVIKVD